MFTASPPPPRDRSTTLPSADTLGTMFDLAVGQYYEALDAEDWSSVFDLRLMITLIHDLDERWAAR